MDFEEFEFMLEVYSIDEYEELAESVTGDYGKYVKDKVKEAKKTLKLAKKEEKHGNVKQARKMYKDAQKLFEEAYENTSKIGSTNILEKILSSLMAGYMTDVDVTNPNPDLYKKLIQKDIKEYIRECKRRAIGKPYTIRYA